MRKWRYSLLLLSIPLMMLTLSGLQPGVTTWAQPSGPQVNGMIRTTDDLVGEIGLALSQVMFAWTKVNIGDTTSTSHIHSALNILEGVNGANYDPEFARPAGLGALPVANMLAASLRELNQPPGAVDYEVAAENIITFIQLAIDRSLNALQSLDTDNDTMKAAEELRLAQALLMAARGAREEKDRPTEGGARTIKAWLEDLMIPAQ